MTLKFADNITFIASSASLWAISPSVYAYMLSRYNESIIDVSLTLVLPIIMNVILIVVSARKFNPDKLPYYLVLLIFISIFMMSCEFGYWLSMDESNNKDLLSREINGAWLSYALSALALASISVTAPAPAPIQKWPYLKCIRWVLGIIGLYILFQITLSAMQFLFSSRSNAYVEAGYYSMYYSLLGNSVVSISTSLAAISRAFYGRGPKDV